MPDRDTQSTEHLRHPALRLAELTLPDLISSADESGAVGSRDGAEFLRNAGIADRQSVVLDSRYYEWCEQVSSSTDFCATDIFAIVNTLSIDFGKFESLFDGSAYETEDVVCYQRLNYGETLCMRQLESGLQLVGRFAVRSGVGSDPSWDFRTDEQTRTEYLRRFAEVRDGLVPTGRYSELEPRGISYDGGVEEIRLEVGGLEPGEFLELEIGVPPELASGGGACSKIVEDGPCSLLISGGDFVGGAGVVTLHLKWRPCAVLVNGEAASRLAGSYPVFLMSRESEYRATLALQVAVPADSGSLHCE